MINKIKDSLILLKNNNKFNNNKNNKINNKNKKNK